VTIPLVFYCNPRRGQVEDFREVARRIAERSPDISPRVLPLRPSPGVLLATLGLPKTSVSVEFGKVRPIAPRGKRLRHLDVPKPEQLRRMDAAGIPVPRWTLIGPDTALDPAEWGPYVVVKPSTAGRGAFVRIFKTEKARFREPASYPKGHPGRKAPMTAQAFVYTGRLPVSFRVLTYLGRPLAAIRYDGKPQRFLESRVAFKAEGGISIVAPAMGCTISLDADPEMLDLAARVHALWPDHPSLGVDFVRDADTGRLHVLETNPRGDSWFLSTPDGRAIQRQFGIDFYAQFGALDRIVEATIDKVRRLAETDRG
jgi:hypothetical protein